VTYPQQPAGGHDPHGGPGPWHAAPSPHGAPQYGHPQYGGGFGPPPPRKNTGAVVAVVAAVVLVLGALGITGFVAPGFLLGDDETDVGGPGPTTTTTTTTTTSAEPPGEDAEALVAALVAGLDSQDAEALADIACRSAGSTVDEAIDDLDAVDEADLLDSDIVSDDEVTATVEITAGSRTGEVEVSVVRDDGDWCWQDITVVDDGEPSGPTSAPTDPGTPTAGGKPVTPEALATMHTFLDSVNTGDAATAKSLLCADAIATPADVDELVGYDPDLRIDPSMDGIASGTESVQLYLEGTAKGQELEGYATNLWVTSYDGPWCVHGFRAVVI
jgi:hypothetical protein